MPQRDFAALDTYRLMPRLLHEVQQADPGLTLLDQTCSAPILPLIHDVLGFGLIAEGDLAVVASELLEDLPEPAEASAIIPLLKNQKMGLLVPQVRALAAKGAPAMVLELSSLASTPPYGRESWRPRSKEELAELRGAAGRPLWLYGVSSPADAEVAMEAGIEAIVVHSGAGKHLNGPAAIEIFPDIFDAVAGMISVYAGGPMRDGIDIFRYLAVGAEAVIVTSERPRAHLQAELEYAMRLTGCRTLADISYEAIFAPLFGET